MPDGVPATRTISRGVPAGIATAFHEPRAVTAPAALLAGVALLGEQPGNSAVAGLGLILLGIALSRRR